jgi:hypothetical protein
MNADKVIRDGKVAVVYSPGFGAGWSTWGEGASPFDPSIVEWIEAGKPAPTPYPDGENADGKYVYNGGLDQARIEWIPVGTQFVIEEYDGSESITYKENENWYTA